MTLGPRRCCCGGPGTPGGGYTDCEMYVRRYNGGAEPLQIPFTPDYIPNWFQITMPESLNLADYLYSAWGMPELIFASDPVVTLCDNTSPIVVIDANCWNFGETFTDKGNPLMAGVDCVNNNCIRGPVIATEFNVNYGECAQVSAEWSYGLSIIPVDRFANSHEGYVWTRLRLQFQAVTPSGHAVPVRMQCWRLSSGLITWPAIGLGFADYPTEAALLLEESFFRGQLGRPASSFNGPWYYDYTCTETPLRMSIDPAKLTAFGMPAPCENRGVDGIVAQAGNGSLPGTPVDAITLYVPASQADFCTSGALCLQACSTEVPASAGFGGGSIPLECFPKTVAVHVPPTIGVAWRADEPCNFVPWKDLRPSPWNRHYQHPETVFLQSLCEQQYSFTPQGLFPLHGVFSNLGGAGWQTSGYVAMAEYLPENPQVGSRLQLYAGFLPLSPATTPANERSYRLFTMARIDAYVENQDGTFAGESLVSAHAGPVFLGADYWTVANGSPLQSDDIRKFGLLANPWNWTHDFKFEGFYHGVVGTPTDQCGYSYPDDLYLCSQAYGITGLSLEDYCRTLPFARCTRGPNYQVSAKIEATIGAASELNDTELLFRYCSQGAPCAPISGNLLSTETAPSTQQQIAQRMSILEARAIDRQRVNRTTCLACPQWNDLGEYCEIAYKTCKCTSPVTRSRAKTESWQRSGVCPENRFTENQQ